MADVLVPVGRHFFTPQQLDAAVAKLPPADGEHQGGVVASVDNDGVEVAVMWTRKDGNIAIRGAYAREWSGEQKVAGDVLWRF